MPEIQRTTKTEHRVRSLLERLVVIVISVLVCLVIVSVTVAESERSGCERRVAQYHEVEGFMRDALDTRKRAGDEIGVKVVTERLRRFSAQVPEDCGEAYPSPIPFIE
jgi:hypothetical protein